MGFTHNKVLLVSSVQEMFRSEGWPLYRTFNNSFIFRNADGDQIAVPQHPTKPYLIYLEELLRNSRILRDEFIRIARPEWDLANGESLANQVHFDLWLDPGNAGVSDIQTLFAALSEVNRAAGGLGLTFQEHQT